MNTLPCSVVKLITLSRYSCIRALHGSFCYLFFPFAMQLNFFDLFVNILIYLMIHVSSFNYEFLCNMK